MQLLPLSLRTATGTLKGPELEDKSQCPDVFCPNFLKTRDRRTRATLGTALWFADIFSARV